MKKEMQNSVVIIGIAVLLVVVMIVWRVSYNKTDTADTETVLSENETETEKSVFKRGSTAVTEVQTLDISTINEKFKDVGFLITQEYDFKDVINYEEAKKLGGIEIVFTKSTLIATYEGTVTAGVDFTSIQVRKNESDKTVKVIVPAAVIKDVTIDHDSMEIIDEKDGLSTSISPKEVNDCLAGLEEQAEADAIERGILTKASNNARLIIENLVKEMLDDSGYTYTIVIQ